jgi:hypothetical protein
MEIFDFVSLLCELSPLLVTRPLSELAYLLPPDIYIPWIRNEYDSGSWLVHILLIFPRQSLYLDQPVSRGIASEHFRKKSNSEKFPVLCASGCTRGGAHNAYWARKIDEYRQNATLRF